MNRTYYFIFFILLINLFVFSQNFEYRTEESPAISWNSINLFDARQLGTGDISFFSSRPFSGISNPALITTCISTGFNLSAVIFDAFQYRGINEGVKTTTAPLLDIYGNISSLAGSFNLSIFKVNIGWYVSDILRFPSFNFRNEYSDNQYDYYKGVFSGQLNNFFSAISYDINKKLTLGLKLNYVSGTRNINLTDESSYNYPINGSTINVKKSTETVQTNKINQIKTTIGLSYKIKPDILLAFAFEYPFNNNVKRTIKRSFINETQNINFTNTANISDSYYSPKKLSLGIKKDFNIAYKNTHNYKKLSLAFETKLILWSDYKYILFGEEILRDMKNSFITGLGLEYGIYSKKKDLFFRAGFKLDPQPVNIISTVFKVLSSGFGIRYRRFSSDIGLAYWFAKSNGINRNNIIISSTISYRFGRIK